MKPLRLTMQAFGPYAQREVVDFSDAMKAGLFGIYGPMGAGKSSIFSAISFALFGEAARGDQDTGSFRSDHAAADLQTEVELVFEVGQKRFCIRRRPEQMRPAQRGGGQTREAHSASIFDATGMALNAITAATPGKVIVEKKVGEVGTYVVQLLGYGAAQFRQIVLLPQGRFETFLLAKTEERVRILRELFDVSLYRDLASKLKEDARNAKSKIVHALAVHQELLTREGCDSLEGLAAFAIAADAEAISAEASAKETDGAAQVAAAALAEARHIDKDFVECEAAQRATEVLQAQAPSFQSKKDLLEGAVLAQGLADVDTAMANADLRARECEDEHAKTTAKRLTAFQIHQESVTRLEREQGRSAERQTLEARTVQLKQWRNALDASAGMRSVRDASIGTLSATSTTLDKATARCEVSRTAKARCAQSLAAGRQAIQQIGLLTTRQTKLVGQREIARQFVAANSALVDAQLARANVKIQCDEADLRRAKAQTAFDQAEHNLSAAQAIHLAEKLIDGEPCPVCGSADHPALARGDASSQNLDHGFRQAKTALEQARQHHSSVQGRLAAADATVSERASALGVMTAPETPLAEIEDNLRELQDELSALGAAPDEQTLTDALAKAEQDLTAVEAAVEAARAAKEVASVAHASALASYTSAISGIPEEYHDPHYIGDVIAGCERGLEAIAQALDTAVSLERAAGSALITCEAEERGALSTLTAAKHQSDVATETFNVRLLAAGMTRERYGLLKPEIANIPQLRAAIDDYERVCISDASRLEHAQARIADLPRPDMSILQLADETASQNRERAQKTASTARVQATRLTDLGTQLSADRLAITAQEVAFAPLGAVADALNGTNASRMDIEAFATTAMFDHVLEAANLRLKPMSSHRYSLQREEEAKGNAKRGLGISVFDLYTGRSRATTTLSGGETFLAALSLALGLSDVVESLSGGIRLDTIFIDEGFGSLDSETLDQALQTLQDLVGQSRTVGLISHVELVQQAIPHGFSIEKSAAGSSVKKRAA
ncbi:MAG: AAA family ATPase [Hyphomonadaceae bacterium]